MVELVLGLVSFVKLFCLMAFQVYLKKFISIFAHVVFTSISILKYTILVTIGTKLAHFLIIEVYFEA